MTIPNDQEAIKPCPFCGSVYIEEIWYDDLAFICRGCGALGPCQSNGVSPLQAWNRRA